eukprot:4783750-Pleurochrysis_carterae.AAC.1
MQLLVGRDARLLFLARILPQVRIDELREPVGAARLLEPHVHAAEHGVGDGHGRREVDRERLPAAKTARACLLRPPRGEPQLRQRGVAVAELSVGVPPPVAQHDLDRLGRAYKEVRAAALQRHDLLEGHHRLGEDGVGAEADVVGREVEPAGRRDHGPALEQYFTRRQVERAQLGAPALSLAPRRRILLELTRGPLDACACEPHAVDAALSGLLAAAAACAAAVAASLAPNSLDDSATVVAIGLAVCNCITLGARSSRAEARAYAFSADDVGARLLGTDEHGEIFRDRDH